MRCLGTGGMGVVYEVFDRERKVRCALKTLRSFDADTLLRFKNEFRALAEIHHPNLVALGELFEKSGHWFFTMELISGVDFLRHVRPQHDESGGDVSFAQSTTRGVYADARPTGDGKRGSIPKLECLPVPDGEPGFDEQRLRAALP